MFRVAKACGQWNVEELAEQIPRWLLDEWSKFLDMEVCEIASAVMSILPAAGTMLGSGGGVKHLTLKTPEEKIKGIELLNSLGAK